MNPRVLLLGFIALVIATSAGAQSSGLRIDLDKPAPAKAAPKKEEKKKDDGKKKKEDEMGKIAGIEIPHGDGFMGLELVNSTFKLTFYNAKKKPIAPDVLRAALRWDVKYQPTPERTVLNSDGGSALVSGKIVKPPYTFKLFITLIKGEGDNAPTEFVSVDFHN